MSRKGEKELNMKKEIVISIFVVILIIVLNIITQTNIKETYAQLEDNLIQLKENMKNNNDDFVKKQIQSIENQWTENYEKLAYYVEHEELEKVETQIVKLKANIDTKEYNVGIENLDTCIYILQHIKDKNALKIVNIF